MVAGESFRNKRHDQPEYGADQITAEWRRSVEGIINTGRLVKEALEALNHGEKSQLWERLPFSERTGQMLAKISKDHRLSNPKYTSFLPPAWYTIYELTKLDDDTFGLALEAMI